MPDLPVVLSGSAMESLQQRVIIFGGFTPGSGLDYPELKPESGEGKEEMRGFSDQILVWNPESGNILDPLRSKIKQI